MGQVLHGSATTTEAVRRTIQLRQESVRALARRYGVSSTTVQKWRHRTTTHDAAMGSKEARSSVPTSDEEAIIPDQVRDGLLSAHPAATRRLPVRLAASPRLDLESLISPDRHSTAAWNGMASAACRTSRVVSPRSSASQPTRSATSMSTSPSACPRKGGGQYGGRQVALVCGHRPYEQVRLRVSC